MDSGFLPAALAVKRIAVSFRMRGLAPRSPRVASLVGSIRAATWVDSANTGFVAGRCAAVVVLGLSGTAGAFGAGFPHAASMASRMRSKGRKVGITANLANSCVFGDSYQQICIGRYEI